MKKYQVVMLISPMGHDVDRIATLVRKWLLETGKFEVTFAGTHKEAECSIESYMIDKEKISNTDLFYFLCSDEYWQNPETEKNLAQAVEMGKGVLFFHGLHPCFKDHHEIEKMVGFMWREKATHGDFNYWDVSMTEEEHPITKGIKSFITKDELFCLLENPFETPQKILVTAYSDEKVQSRWSHEGTGREEPVLTIGNYGKGRTVNFILGHVWTYYTGHGLMEDTMIAFEPSEFKILLMRSCEWAVSGEVTL